MKNLDREIVKSIIFLSVFVLASCNQYKCKEIQNGLKTNECSEYDSFKICIFLPSGFSYSGSDTDFTTSVLYATSIFKNPRDTNFIIFVGIGIRPLSYKRYTADSLTAILVQRYRNTSCPDGDFDFGYLDTVNCMTYIHSKEYAAQFNTRIEYLSSFFLHQYVKIGVLHKSFRQCDTSYFNAIRDSVISSVHLEKITK